MGADERKAILVIANRIEGDIPSLYRVATLAIGSELAAMDVCVAVCTIGTYILENEAGVALRAAHFLVHPTERISGLIVVELGVGTDWFPTCVRMAVLARNVERAMGIGHLGLRTAGCWPCLVHRLLQRHCANYWKQHNAKRMQPTTPAHHYLPNVKIQQIRAGFFSSRHRRHSSSSAGVRARANAGQGQIVPRKQMESANALKANSQIHDRQRSTYVSFESTGGIHKQP